MSELKDSPSTATTVEKTSKSIKLQKLISVIMFIVGAVMTFTATSAETVEPSTTGALLMVGGAIWYIVTRARAWWHHD